MKNSTIVGLAVGTAIAVGAVVCYHIWRHRDAEWDIAEAALTLTALTDDYNEAVKANPADRGRASFAFDLLADRRLKDFTLKYAHCAEFSEWRKQFLTKCKDLNKAIRKP